MTRRDYIETAAFLSNLSVSKNNKQLLIELLSALFVRDNPRFNKAKFIAACNG